MAWERILIVQISSGKASNGNPYLRIDGVNERGRTRKWFCFGNERVLGRPDHVQMSYDDFERVLIFSNGLHLLLAAVTPNLQPMYREYVQAVQREDDPADIRGLEAGLETEAVETVGEIALEEDALRMAGIAERLQERLVGKIAMVDWNPDANNGHGEPSSHAVPYLPDTEKTKPGSLFAGRRISTHLKKAASRRRMSLQESILAAQKSVTNAPDMFTPPPELLGADPVKEEIDEDDLF